MCNCLVLVVIFALGASGQNCRYVTVPVCDAQSTSSTSEVIGLKGDKGDFGIPGKAGPAGDEGVRGEKGQKGRKGDTADVLQQQMIERFADIEATLQTLLLPTTCSASSVVGYQMLRSGDHVYCDGGWTVFQKRFDGSIDFQRSWNSYKRGFGNFSTEFWLGLDKIHELTSNRGCRLRVDLWTFDDDHAFSEYSSFSIEDESDLYRLHVAGYSGIAGDSLAKSDHTLDGMAFTTMDRDNDLNSRNCASNVFGVSGGWWYRSCQHGKLNAIYGNGNSAGPWHNMVWDQWKGENVALKASLMKLRCD